MTREVSRHGPTLSILGVITWVLTFAVFLLLAPPDRDLATAPVKADRMRMVLAVVFGGLGTFSASVICTIGWLLSMAARRDHPGPWARAGVVLGLLGTATLLVVLAGILKSVISP